MKTKKAKTKVKKESIQREKEYWGLLVESTHKSWITYSRFQSETSTKTGAKNRNDDYINDRLLVSVGSTLLMLGGYSDLDAAKSAEDVLNDLGPTCAEKKKISNHVVKKLRESSKIDFEIKEGLERLERARRIAELAGVVIHSEDIVILYRKEARYNFGDEVVALVLSKAIMSADSPKTGIQSTNMANKIVSMLGPKEQDCVFRHQERQKDELYKKGKSWRVRFLIALGWLSLFSFCCLLMYLTATVFGYVSILILNGIMFFVAFAITSKYSSMLGCYHDEYGWVSLALSGLVLFVVKFVI